MNWRQYVRARLPRLSTSAEREIEIVEELAAQLEATYARAVAAGTSHEEALAQAEDEVPDWHALAEMLARIEPSRQQPPPHGPAWSFAGFADDVRYAMRGFAAWRALPAATLMLALSLGALMTVFAAVDAWLLRPVPFADPGRLAVVWGTNHDIGQVRDVVSGPTFLDWQRRSRAFEKMAAFAQTELTIRLDGRAGVVGALQVTPEFFDVLGVRAAAGRTFNLADAGAPDRVIMISHAAWQSRFGGDPAVVGRTLTDIGLPHEVVGVLPPGFGLLSEPAVVTLLDPRALAADERSRYHYWIVARLRQGMSLTQAQQDLDEVMTALAREYAGMRGWSATVEPLLATLAEPIRAALLVLLATAALVLVIGVGNTANLLSSRALDRRRDVAIRIALGASGLRLRRQWLIESAVLAGAGMALGVALALAAVRLVAAVRPASAAIAGSAATVDLPPLALSAGSLPIAGTLVVAIALILGSLPLGGLDPALLRSVHQASASTSVLMSRGRRWLLAGQTAVATLLMSVAGLLLATVLQIVATSPGFDGSRVTVFMVGGLDELDFPARRQYFMALLQRVAGTPGVISAALNDYVPLTNEDDYEGIEIPGRPRDAQGQLPREEWRRVSAGYFETMGIPLLRGRLLTPADDDRAASVVILSEAMARKYWPGGDPLGQHIRISSKLYGWAEVVGIVGDVREAGLDRPVKPMIFVPFHREPRPVMGLFVETASGTAAMTAAIREAISAVDPGRPVFDTRAMHRIVSDSYAIQRSTLWVAAGLAGLALLMMLGGTYAVVSLVTASRTLEIGLRRALGARTLDVLATVLGPACRSAAAGVALGVGAAVAAAGVLRTQINGVPELDLTMAAAVAALVGVAVGAACLAPARRALRIDPAVALRNE